MGDTLPKGAMAPVKGTFNGALELRPVLGSSVHGMAMLRQHGKTISSSVVVWGLAPGTKHAAHIHGPRAT